jgi:polysaccharide biosynthesis/export protein
MFQNQISLGWKISLLLFFLIKGLPSLCGQGVTPVVGTNKTNVAVNYIRPETHVISVGDKLSFRVIEDREEARILTVSAGGELEIPYYGRILVVGKTVTNAAREIKALLERQLYYQATVQLAVEEAVIKIAMSKPKQVTLVGQVRMQGPQEMPSDEKYMLSRAILRAGGFGAFANTKKVLIIRQTPDGKSEKITANVNAVLKDGKTEDDVELQPDDMIIVPEKILNF